MSCSDQTLLPTGEAPQQTYNGTAFVQKPPKEWVRTIDQPGFLVVSMYCSVCQSPKGVGTHPRCFSFVSKGDSLLCPSVSSHFLENK